MDYNKKYGLTVPKKTSLFQKNKSTAPMKPRLAAFKNDDSSDDDVVGQKEVNSQIHREAMKKIVKKQTKMEIQKALEEDASVYEYDNIYDDMKREANKKNVPENVIKADVQKKPKYIGNLIKASQQRNRERQRVEERKIEKERKNEGDQFSDKPAFVTSAYKKRMEEMQQEEEEERRMAAIEDAMDVRKQKDLSGFYKHLLRRQVGEESLPGERPVKEPRKSDQETAPEDHQNKPDEEDDDHDTDLSFSSSDDEVSSPARRLSKEKKLSPDRRSESRNSSSHHEKSRSPHGRESDRHASDRQYDSDRQRHRSRRDRQSRSPDRKANRERTNRSPDHRSKQDQDRSSSQGSKRHRDDSSPKHRTHKTRENESNSRSSKHGSPDRKQGRLTDDKDNKNVSDKKDKPDDKDISSKFAKRTNVDSAMSARDRYLARKNAGKTKRAPVELDSD